MTTAKSEVQKILDRLPADVSYEEIQYQIYVRQKVERGLREIDAGEGVSHEVAIQRMSKWIGK